MSSCAALVPREEPASARLSSGIASNRVPDWAKDRLAPCWWTQYQDAALNFDIECALSSSPDLEIIAARLERADAEVCAARSAAWPSLNLGYGFRFGREKEPGKEPMDLKPWTGSANFSWELDIHSKLRRARESAEFNRRALFWELAAAKLVLASRIAQSRFLIYRLEKEGEVIGESLSAIEKILAILRDREKSGLVAMTEVHRMEAEAEKLRRTREELNLMHQIAEVELDTLKGGGERNRATKGRLPKLPPIPARCFDELVACHPAILAAEAEVRAAFRLEEYSRLQLLPSFTLQGSLTGASSHFFLDELGRWVREIGPVLDIPVFDPARLAAIKSRRAQTNEASANYRSTLVGIVGEVDAAYATLESRRRQHQSARREAEALAKARQYVTANLRAGLVSQIEVLESERSYLEASRAQISLEEAVLRDHVALVRALGGGGGEEHGAPPISAQPVIRASPVEIFLSPRPED